MKVSFSTWPVWNYHFPTKDARGILAVRYYDAAGDLQELPRDRYRLAISRHGVSALVLHLKNTLPETADRHDAVEVEYEP